VVDVDGVLYTGGADTMEVEAPFLCCCCTCLSVDFSITGVPGGGDAVVEASILFSCA